MCLLNSNGCIIQYRILDPWFYQRNLFERYKVINPQVIGPKGANAPCNVYSECVSAVLMIRCLVFTD